MSSTPANVPTVQIAAVEVCLRVQEMSVKCARTSEGMLPAAGNMTTEAEPCPSVKRSISGAAPQWCNGCMLFMFSTCMVGGIPGVAVLLYCYTGCSMPVHCSHGLDLIGMLALWVLQQPCHTVYQYGHASKCVWCCKADCLERTDGSNADSWLHVLCFDEKKCLVLCNAKPGPRATAVLFLRSSGNRCSSPGWSEICQRLLFFLDKQWQVACCCSQSFVASWITRKEAARTPEGIAFVQKCAAVHPHTKFLFLHLDYMGLRIV